MASPIAIIAGGSDEPISPTAARPAWTLTAIFILQSHCRPSRSLRPEIALRWAEGRYERLPQLAADLVNRKVAVIAAAYFPATLAAKAATSTIPIVFISGVDPIAAGLVTSLNRPGGNLTGVSNFNTSLTAKRLELLHQVVPRGDTIAVLVNSTSPAAQTIEAEARS